MEQKTEIASLLLKTEAVTLSPAKPFTWASGIESPIYTDNRILLSCPQERRKVVSAFVENVKRQCPHLDVIAGVATSGIPWAAWVAEALGKPLVYVRSEKKGHGKANLVEGRLSKGQKAVVIEDLVSTGGSSVAAVEGARVAGAQVSHCFAIFTYGMPKAAEAFRNASCKLVTLTDFQSLIALASETGYIGKGDREKVLAFSKNPQNWKA